MKIEMTVNLDYTLGCGQAHRWVKKDGVWEGVLGREIVTLKQTENGFECAGTKKKKMILEYFRNGDDLNEIYGEISKDRFVKERLEKYYGLRILKQEPWECIGTYLLATNANVKRIGQMVESVCAEFGDDLGGRHSFPTPEQIVNGSGNIKACRLGYREERFLKLAEDVLNGNLDPCEMEKMDYAECRETLLAVNGIGNKVADCIALFGYGHLNAFPIDARIEKIMKEKYGRSGSYADVSTYASKKFGRFAGYAQEFLYCGI